jgi:hypothetical protein
MSADSSPLFSAEKVPPLNVYSYDELMARRMNPQRYLVDPLIPLGGLTAISGKGDRWKTWVMDHLALCVAGERSFFGHFATIPGKVLVLALEGGLDEHQRRIAALSGNPRPSGIPLFTYEGILNGKESEQADQLAATIDLHKPDLVTVDHLRALFGGVEDASDRARDIQVFVRRMQSVYPSTWVALAHEGKNGDTIRGSSGQDQILDSWLAIDRMPGDVGKITHKKAKRGKRAAPFEFRFVGPEEPGGAGFMHLGEREEDGSESDLAEIDGAIIGELDRAGGRMLRAELVKRLKEHGDEHKIDRGIVRLEKARQVGREMRGRVVEIYRKNGARR